jgi:vancomycin permeability regulator SanA
MACGLYGRPMRVLVAGVLTGLVAGVFGWAEWEHSRASGRRLGMRRAPVGREAIVVLGFRNRGTRANYMNRYRVSVALRSVDVTATESLLILCGGGVASEVPEAELMARYARDERGYQGAMHLDFASQTTWENIENAVVFLEGFDTIKIASNSLHAEKARAYLWKQRPDLAARTAQARDYRFGEIWFVKPIAAFLGVKNLQQLGP